MPADNSPLAALGGYSKREELANAVTHGVALVLAIAGLVLLVTFSVLADAGAKTTAQRTVPAVPPIVSNENGV